MTKVALSQFNVDANEAAYRAMSAGNQAVGRTAGEALDALMTQLPAEQAICTPSGR